MSPTSAGAALLAGALAGLAVAMPVGAIGSYLIGLAARERFAVAAAAAMGVATIDGLYALIAGLGIGGIERFVGQLAGPLRWVAAAVLVAAAVRTLAVAVRRHRTLVASSPGFVPQAASPGSTPQAAGRSGAPGPTYPRSSPDRPDPPSARRTYGLLVGLTAVNPATIATFAAVAAGPVAAGPGAAWHGAAGQGAAAADWYAGLLFGLGAFVASTGWQLTLVTGGTLLGRVLSGRRGQLVVASVSAAMMLVLALVTLAG